MSEARSGSRWSAALPGWIAVGLLLLLTVPLAVTHASNRGVGALAALRNGQLALLDTEGGVSLADPKTGTLRRLDVTFAPFGPNDLGVYWTPRTGDQLLVTMSRQNRGSIQTRLARYDLSGKLTGEWLSYGGLANWTGPVVEPDGRTAYVANSLRPEVYRIDLTRSRAAPAQLVAIREGETLGPMALDARRRRLLVADPFQGFLFELKLDPPASALLLRNLGEPSALALDAPADRLFVADAAGGQILVVGLGETVPRARPLPRIKGLEEPHGLALGTAGTLWAAGYRTSTLFQLGSSGSLINSFLPRLGEPPRRR